MVDPETGCEETPSKVEKANFMRNAVTDNCLYHALCQAEAYYEHREDNTNKEKRNKYLRSVNKGERKRESGMDIFQAVREMKIAAGMEKSRDFDRTDIEQLQNTVYAGRFQIIVFTENSRKPYYSGPYIKEGKHLVLYFTENHFCGVRSIVKLLDTWYYCTFCHTRYSNKHSHFNCPLLHRPCGGRECITSPNDEEKQCEKCCVTFRSELCFWNHVQKGQKGSQSRCDATFFCKTCNKAYFTKYRSQHSCKRALMAKKKKEAGSEIGVLVEEKDENMEVFEAQQVS